MMEARCAKRRRSWFRVYNLAPHPWVFLILSTLAAGTNWPLSPPSGVEAQFPVFTWTGTTSADWDEFSNWSPNGVPAGNAIAVIKFGSVRLGGRRGIYGIDLEGASTHLHAKELEVTRFNFKGGMLSGNVAIPAGGSMIISTPADHDIPDLTLTNLGTIIWTNGPIRGGGAGTRIINLGVWDARGAEMNGAYGGNELIFDNQGIFLKGIGKDTVIQPGVRFMNNGIVEVRTNALILNNGAVFLNGASFVGAGQTRLNAGIFTVNGSILSSNLVQTGGILAGTNTFKGSFTWSNGHWNNRTFTTIAVDSMLRIVGGGNSHDMNGHVLTNFGLVLWSGGTVRSGSGGRIENHGVWEMSADGELNGSLGSNGVTFNNHGLFLKSSGVGNSIISSSVIFNNFGQMAARSGVVQLAAESLLGGSVTGSVAIVGRSLLSGTVIENGVRNGLGGLVSGDWLGTLVCAGGAFTGRTMVQEAATLNITAGARFDNCALTNAGSVRMLGGNVSGFNSVIENLGVWEIPGALELQGIGLVFHNKGRLLKSGPPGLASFQPGVQLINHSDAIVEAEHNALVLNGGGHFKTESKFIGFGATRLAAGTFHLDGLIHCSNIVQTGGILTGNPEIAGMYTWSGGTWNSPGTTTVKTNSQLRILTVVNHDLADRTLLNEGVVLWLSGAIRGGSIRGDSLTRVINRGIWQVDFDAQAINFLGSNSVLFLNQGTFRKTGGTGALLFHQGADFINEGLVELRSGSLYFGDQVKLDGGTLALTLSTERDFSRLSFAKSINLAGTLSAVLSDDYKPTPGVAFELLTFPSSMGTFAKIEAPPGGNWEGLLTQTNFALRFAEAIETNLSPQVFRMESPVKTLNTIQLNFQFSTGDVNKVKLLSSSKPPGPYVLEPSAVLTSNTVPGSYRFIAAATNDMRFYRLRLNP